MIELLVKWIQSLRIRVVFTACVCVAVVIPMGAQESRLNIESESVEPFQIFDNVYYIGTSWVSCYAVDTGDRLVLIDALYGGFPQLAMKHLKQLGLGDRKVKYVLASHGHWDHAGGAAFFQKELGAVIGMTKADWSLARESAVGVRSAFFTGGVPLHDLVIEDGDVLEVGNTTFRCFVTPGHTEGVLSLAFDVRDGERTHRAFVFGGVGLNFQGVERTRSYLKSVDRIRTLAESKPVIDVSLSNHPVVARILERERALKNRGAGDPHPFVDAIGFLNDLKGFRQAAERKLQEELAGARP
ncbi:MBL fold metallo-hydrolase [bacterium]|jgi:metallo-beta-lactamase class B|nr:MBL fold metallo-hydrolase [bacterium]